MGSHDKVKKWLDKDLTSCIQKEPEKMKMLIRGMKRSMSTDGDTKVNKDDLYAEVIKSIKQNWISNVFKESDPNEIIQNYEFVISAATGSFIEKEPEYDFSKVIETLINQVLKDDEIVPEVGNNQN